MASVPVSELANSRSIRNCGGEYASLFLGARVRNLVFRAGDRDLVEGVY